MQKLGKNHPLIKSLRAVFVKMSRQGLQGAKRPSNATVKQKEEVIIQEMNFLYLKKYKLQDIKNIKLKHFECIYLDCFNRGYKEKTFRQRITIFRQLFKLIDKNGLEITVMNRCPIPDGLFTQIKKPKPRKMADFSQCLEIIDKVKDENCIIAIHAELVLVFSISIKEALMIRPVTSHRQNILVITHGVSKGRERYIKITTDYQREVIERAKATVDYKSIELKPSNKTYKQWLDKFNYLLNKNQLRPSDLINAYQVGVD